MERRRIWGRSRGGWTVAVGGSKSGSRGDKGERSTVRSFGSDMGGRRATTIGEGGEIMGNKDWAAFVSADGRERRQRLCDGRWDGRRHEVGW